MKSKAKNKEFKLQLTQSGHGNKANTSSVNYSGGGSTKHSTSRKTFHKPGTGNNSSRYLVEDDSQLIDRSVIKFAQALLLKDQSVAGVGVA